MAIFQHFRSQGLVLAAVIVMMLMTLASLSLWKDLPNQPGIDFYQFWGVAKSQQSSGFRLGSPYLDSAGYQQQLLRLAGAEQDENLIAAVSTREQPDLTGSPLLYYLLGMLPRNYTTALRDFRVAQFAGFVVGAFLLARRFTSGPVSALFLAASLAAALDPLLLDMAVGNLSALQLLGLVVAAALLGQRDGDSAPLGMGQIVPMVVWLILLTMVKPNIAVATILLGACLYLKCSRRDRMVVAVVAIAAGALFYALPCVLFSSASVWMDWWNATFSSAGRLAYAESYGNYSGLGLLTRWLGISGTTAMLMTGFFLLSSLLWSVSSARAAPLTAWRDYPVIIRNSLLDPYLCIAFGVLVSFALSPLVWSHYQVLGVIPALWLCREQRAGSLAPSVAGWLALLLFADLPRRIYLLAGTFPRSLIEANHGFGWLLPWVGIIAALHLRERARMESAAMRAD